VRVRRLILLLSCLAVSPGVVKAQSSDPHFETPRLTVAAHHSPFVHGYLHGYEEGFHQGDFDLHMGRIARGEYARNTSPVGYRKQFGSRQMYVSGYHEGFDVGYADAAAGRSFRAVDNVAAATENEHLDGKPSGVFDEGIRSGYVAGQHQGLDDARRQIESHPAPACPVNSGRSIQEYCGAYASGYGMGYSDGFVNQAKTTVAEAKK
jgi:hypothetical protein